MGTKSLIGNADIITPAACVDVFLGIPSRRLAISNRFLTLASVSYRCLNSEFSWSTLSMDTSKLGLFGM